MNPDSGRPKKVAPLPPPRLKPKDRKPLDYAGYRLESAAVARTTGSAQSPSDAFVAMLLVGRRQRLIGGEPGTAVSWG